LTFSPYPLVVLVLALHFRLASVDLVAFVAFVFAAFVVE